jgi:hypothetical protein
LKKSIYKAKKEHLESVLAETMDFQRTGRHDVTHTKKKKSGWKENGGNQTTGIQDFRRNKIVVQSQVMRNWESYITELYERPNLPENL